MQGLPIIVAAPFISVPTYLPSYRLSKALLHATHSTVPNNPDANFAARSCRASQGIDGSLSAVTCVTDISLDGDPWYQVDMGDMYWVIAVSKHCRNQIL